MIELLSTLTLLTFSNSDKKLCALHEVLSIFHFILLISKFFKKLAHRFK